MHTPAIPNFVAALAVAMLLQGCPSSPSGGGGDGAGDRQTPRATTFSKSFGGDGYDTARAAIGTSDGGYAFVGYMDGDSLYGDFSKLWINKLDANGNTEWQRALGGGAPGAIGLGAGVMRQARATSDGGAIIAGHVTSRTGGFDTSDIYVAKLSALGALEWSRTHDSGAWTEAFARSQYGRGPQADDVATDLDLGPDGGYLLAASSVANVVTGSGQVHVNAKSLVVMRLTADGDAIWQRRLVDGQFARDGDVSTDTPIEVGYAPIVRATHDNGAIVAYTLRLESGEAPRVRIIRFDSGGVVRWQHDEELDTVGAIRATDLAQTHDVNPADGLRDGIRDDGFIVTIARWGDSRGGIVLKLAADGAVQWRRGDFDDDADLFAVEQLCVPRSSGGGFDCDFVAAGAGGRFREQGYAVRLTALGATILERQFDTLGVIRDIGGSSDSALLRGVARSDAEGISGSHGTIVLDKGTLNLRDNFLSGDRSEGAELVTANGLLTFDTSEQLVRRYAAAAALPEADVSLEFEFDVSRTGTAKADSLVETAPNSFIVGGRFSGVPWLLRITNGSVDWQRTFGDGTRGAAPVHVAKASDGGVFMSGTVYEGHFVARMSADGTLVWQSEEVGDYDTSIRDMQALPDGGVVVVTQETVTRFDRDGRSVWRREVRLGSGFGSPGVCCHVPLDSIALSDDGGFAVTRPSGYSGNGYFGQFSVIKLDGEGNVLWNFSYRVLDGYDLGGYATPIRATPDGGYVVAITEAYTVSRDAPSINDAPFGEANVLIVKLDRDGIVQWSRSYGAFLDEALNDLHVLTDGGLLIAGGSHSFGVNSEAWLLRTGQDGLVAEGCNAHLVSMPASAFSVSDQEAGPTMPVSLGNRAPIPLATLTDTNVVPNTPETVIARQCLGSANPVAPPPVSARFTLTLAQPGTQTGVVTSTPAGMTCGTAASAPPCTASFDAGTDVFLDVDPGSRDRFLRWEDCTEVLPASAGTARCRVRMSADRNVRAVFGAAQDRFLLRMTVNGSGGVRSTEAGGIECGSALGANQRCEQLYDRFVAGSTVPNSVSLAVSSGVADFRGWGGDCAALGTATAANLTLDADKNCTATFDTTPGVANLDVVVIGADGVIIDDDRTIDCSEQGPDCQQSYPLGTEIGLGVDLQATTAILQSWSGDCAFAGNQRRLRLTMDGNKQCTATFAPTAPQRFALTVQKTGFAASVVSAPSGIDCGGTCVAEFNSGQTVRLTATPAAPGGTISGWTGCDRLVTGTSGMFDCEVDMSSAKPVQVRIE